MLINSNTITINYGGVMYDIQIQHLLKLNYYYYHHNIPTVGIQIQHLLKLNKKYNKITAWYRGFKYNTC